MVLFFSVDFVHRHKAMTVKQKFGQVLREIRISRTLNETLAVT